MWEIEGADLIVLVKIYISLNNFIKIIHLIREVLKIRLHEYICIRFIMLYI